MKMVPKLQTVFVLLGLLYGSYGAGYKRVCYYSNWSQYRQGPGRFVPADIDANLCTHLVYSFANLPMTNYELAIYAANDPTLYQQFNGLKTQNPDLKTLLAVGGWTAGSLRFSNLAQDANLRQKFARTSAVYLRRYGFDGLDMDWEYPALRGGRPADKQNFVLLLKDIMEEFEREASRTGKERLLLTIAVPAGKNNIDTGYNITEVHKYLDFINLMSYDLHGGWESTVGHNSPLFARAGESGSETYLNTAWAANYWHTEGTPKNKLIIGLATYGRGFRLSNPSQYQPGSNAAGTSPPGTYTGESGFYSYYEICQMAGTRYWMDDAKVPYFVTTDGRWIGYDDVESFNVKLEWIKSENYGGAMIWNIDLDDFKKTCTDSTEPYPLMSRMEAVLGPYTPPPTSGPGVTSSNGPTNNPATTTTLPATTTTQGQTDAPGVFTCAGKVGRYHADPTDCSKYYQCWNGIAYPGTCQSGLLWSQSCPCCDYADNVDCNQQTAAPTTAAPATTTSTTAAPTTTTSTTAAPITATSTTAAPATSPQPTNAPGSSTQGNTPSGTDVNCNGVQWALLPDPRDCNRYYQCSDGVKHHMRCPSGLHWTQSCLCCDYPDRSDCVESGDPPQTTTEQATSQPAATTQSTQPTTAAGSIDYNFCAYKPSGLYAIPVDCYKYYNCGNGQTYVYSCPPGTAYNPVFSYCDHAWNVDCSGRGG